MKLTDLKVVFVLSFKFTDSKREDAVSSFFELEQQQKIKIKNWAFFSHRPLADAMKETLGANNCKLIVIIITEY